MYLAPALTSQEKQPEALCTLPTCHIWQRRVEASGLKPEPSLLLIHGMRTATHSLPRKSKSLPHLGHTTS